MSESKKTRAEKIKEATLSPQLRPTVASVLDHFFNHAGGAQAVAKMLFDEFNAANQGSQIRNKVLELVLRRMEKSEAAGRLGDNLDDLTTEDLLLVIAQREEKMRKDIGE